MASRESGTPEAEGGNGKAGSLEDATVAVVGSTLDEEDAAKHAAAHETAQTLANTASALQSGESTVTGASLEVAEAAGAPEELVAAARAIESGETTADQAVVDAIDKKYQVSDKVETDQALVATASALQSGEARRERKRRERRKERASRPGANSDEGSAPDDSDESDDDDESDEASEEEEELDDDDEAAIDVAGTAGVSEELATAAKAIESGDTTVEQVAIDMAASEVQKANSYATGAESVGEMAVDSGIDKIADEAALKVAKIEDEIQRKLCGVGEKGANNAKARVSLVRTRRLPRSPAQTSLPCVSHRLSSSS